MKLNVYILSLLALSAIRLQTATAQTAPQGFPQTLGTATTAFPETPGAKTTGIGSRPLAISQHNSNGSTLMPVDSQSYTYPSASTLLNDATVRYSYSGGAWTPAYKDVFEYNAKGELSGFETLRWYTSDGTWNTYRRGVYTLNAGGQPTDITMQEWNSTSSTWFNVERHLYTRDAANYPTVYVTQQWNHTYNRWTDVARYSYTYNAKHAYKQYTQEAWLELYGLWLPQLRLDYFYDASDTMLTMQNQSAWASNLQSWANVYRTYFSIDAATGHPSGAEMKSFNNSGGEQNFRRMDFDYNAAGLRTAETVEQWYSNNTYDFLYQFQYTYNSENLPVAEDVKYWRNGAWSYANANAYRKNTYYENYTTSVHKPAAVAINELRLSPVPATNFLDIRLSWSEPQDFKVLITDLSGRIVSQFSQPAQQQFSTSVSVASIPAGNYMLTVLGSKGASLTRMISVAH